jgi:thiamine biosynthesis lipoprotein
MSCSRTATRKRARPLLGTFVEIALSAPAADPRLDDRRLDDCITRGFAAVQEVEERMSRYRDGSDLGRLNAARPGEWIAVHPSVVEVLATANLLFHRSGGAFDIRCGEWLGETAPPAGLDPGGPPVEIDGTRVRRTSPQRLDLGGIAKGYAVDCAVEAIRQRAGDLLTAGVINAGGDLRVWGEEEQAVGIRIDGVDRNDGEAGTHLYPLQVREAAVATSAVRPPGQQERAPRNAGHVRMSDGSLAQGPVTVTAIADRCLLADALTKIVILASAEIARRCLVSCGAQALVFSAAVRLQQVLP